MPWLETDPMDKRLQFILDDQRGLYDRTELCARYGISPKTGYKRLARCAANGRRGLQAQPRAPHHCPHWIPEAVAQPLCAARRAHPDWGPVKLLDWLRARHPRVAWPAASTVGDLLTRAGLVTHRRRRHPHAHPWVVPPTTSAPNDLWTADIKGQVPIQDGILCYPLTIADQHTRFLLTCLGVRSTHGVLARPVFERAFRGYGLPRAIRPPRATRAAQQRAFNAFRREHNDERPHTFLDGQTPASHYQPFPRPFPSRLPSLEYTGHFLVKKVTTCGSFRFGPKLLYVANAPPINTSGSRRRTTASGPSSSTRCYWPASTSATSSCMADRPHVLTPRECHPCFRFTLLPVFPVAHRKRRAGMSMPLVVANKRGELRIVGSHVPRNH